MTRQPSTFLDLIVRFLRYVFDSWIVLLKTIAAIRFSYRLLLALAIVIIAITVRSDTFVQFLYSLASN